MSNTIIIIITSCSTIDYGWKRINFIFLKSLTNSYAGIYRGRMGFEDLFNIIENNVMYEDFEPEQFIPSADGKKVVVVGHTKSKSKLIPNSTWVCISIYAIKLRVSLDRVVALQIARCHSSFQF